MADVSFGKLAGELTLPSYSNISLLTDSIIFLSRLLEDPTPAHDRLTTHCYSCSDWLMVFASFTSRALIGKDSSVGGFVGKRGGRKITPGKSYIN